MIQLVNSWVLNFCLQTHIFSLQDHCLSHLTRLFFLSISSVVGFRNFVNIPIFTDGFLLNLEPSPSWAFPPGIFKLSIFQTWLIKTNTILFFFLIRTDPLFLIIQDVTLTSLSFGLELVPVELVANQRFFGK